MDAVTMYLEAADLLLEDYKEISYFSEVFEAGDESIQEAQQKNAEIEKKSTSLLSKAITGIKAIFKRIRDLIDDVIAYVKADGTKKSQYQEFCEAIKNNPEFAKKKVTFKQYSIIAKQWNERLSAEEAQYRKIKDEELENKETFAKDIEAGWDKARAKILDKGKVVAKEVPVEFLIQEAKTCRDGALSARNKLNWYEMILGNLEKDLGKKEAKKVKRKLKMLSSRFALVRKLAGGLETEYLTWRDALKNVFSVDAVKNVLSRNKELRKDVAKAGIHAGAAIADVAGTGTALGVSDALEDKHKLKKYVKNHEKNIQKLKDVMVDESLREDQKRIYIKRNRAKIPKQNRY